MKTDGKYSLAIEIALGAGLQEHRSGPGGGRQERHRLPEAAEGGRATFLPLTAIRGEELRERGVENEFGFVGVASGWCASTLSIHKFLTAFWEKR